ncbi:immunoglobulin delta heavy chain-like [Pristis pectinata]|uniref:immunoglobulin delta heavy chain-like n=1 Tax=Pristis pectinata TaxID=685728 RepID=UPI00223E8B82|nr:immunoglobulin delta heavy chain-like [Pristis pectinata]
MGVAPYLCLLLSCLAGVRSDVVLTQPASAVVKPGESYRLTCAVSGSDLSSYYMSWVKQVSGKGLEWLVAYYSESYKYYAPGVQDRFTASKDSSNFYLQMNSLRPDDTATYYCARDTVRGSGTGPGQKPSESARPQGAEGQDGTDHRSRVPALLCRRRPSLEWEACCQPRFLGGEAGGTEGLSGSLQRAARSQAPWVGLESPIGPAGCRSLVHSLQSMVGRWGTPMVRETLVSGAV